MFGKGLLIREDNKKLKEIFKKEEVGITLHWIIIRFCQMCGIVLSASSVQHLTEKFMADFQFTRVDIIEFIVKIKCPPILDYYTGMHYLTQAKNEKVLGSRLTLFKAAFQRLENIQNYEFPFVGEYYAESLFGAMKLDSKVIGDVELVSRNLRKRWIRHKEENKEDSKDFVDYLCSSLWRLFTKPEKEIKDNVEESKTVEINMKKVSILDHSPMKKRTDCRNTTQTPGYR